MYSLAAVADAARLVLTIAALTFAMIVVVSVGLVCWAASAFFGLFFREPKPVLRLAQRQRVA